MEWRKIESAPLDEEILLAWLETWPEKRWRFEAGIAGKSNRCPRETGYSDGWLHGSATHWIPLPAPPTAE
jgi:hypothetical protein